MSNEVLHVRQDDDLFERSYWEKLLAAYFVLESGAQCHGMGGWIWFYAGAELLLRRRKCAIYPVVGIGVDWAPLLQCSINAHTPPSYFMVDPCSDSRYALGVCDCIV